MTGEISLSRGTHDGLSGHDPDRDSLLRRETARLQAEHQTATYHDPEHPGQDIHGVDHGAMQGVKAIDLDSPRAIVVTMKVPVSELDLMSFIQHLRSWHPCVGFADGK